MVHDHSKLRRGKIVRWKCETDSLNKELHKIIKLNNEHFSKIEQCDWFDLLSNKIVLTKLLRNNVISYINKYKI